MFLDGADDCGRIGTTVPAVERHHAETAVFRGFRGSRRMCSTGCFTLFCDVVGHHLRRVDGREIVVPIRDFAQQRSDARDRRDDGEGGVMPYGTGNRNRQCWNPQQRCQRNQIRQRQVAVPTGRHFAQSDPQHAYQQHDPQRNTHANPLEMAIIRRTKTANEHIQHSEFVRFG